MRLVPLKRKKLSTFHPNHEQLAILYLLYASKYKTVNSFKSLSLKRESHDSIPPSLRKSFPEAAIPMVQRGAFINQTSVKRLDYHYCSDSKGTDDPRATGLRKRSSILLRNLDQGMCSIV